MLGIFDTRKEKIPDFEIPYPKINKKGESNIKGLYIIGDLGGKPVIKLAANHGVELMEHLSALPDIRSGRKDVYDIIIVGAGPAGLSAALEAEKKKINYLILEKGKVANTIYDYPRKKDVAAEPDHVDKKGDLWIQPAKREEFLEQWDSLLKNKGVHKNIKENEEVKDIQKNGDTFEVTTSNKRYRAKRVIFSIGKRGTPRKLGAKGEDRPKVYYKLDDPDKIKGKNIFIVGSGDMAVETALALCKDNKVSISCLERDIVRCKEENYKAIMEGSKCGDITMYRNAELKEIKDDEVVLIYNNEERRLPNDYVFVMIGAVLPAGLFKKMRLKMEGQWDLKRYLLLALSCIGVYSIYAFKCYYWPFTRSGPLFKGLDASLPWPFISRSAIYTMLYTSAIVGFGSYAIITKYKTSLHQTIRFFSFFFFQIVMFFVLPFYIFNQAFYESHGQNFLFNPGLSWGLVYAWPLQSYPFMEQGVAAIHGISVWSGQPLPAGGQDASIAPFIYTLVLAFVFIPVFVYFLGKRYCSWICSCGGLGETLGDAFRKYAPKGWRAKKHEDTGTWILIANVLVFGYVLLTGIDIATRGWYTDIVDVWLAGIIPVAITFFYSGKVWCRMWCPLAAYMGLVGKIASRFRLAVNKAKCIGCYECTRSCQIGIDVMQFVQKDEDITMKNTSCIGCGVCIFTCPMKALKFGKREKAIAA